MKRKGDTTLVQPAVKKKAIPPDASSELLQSKLSSNLRDLLNGQDCVPEKSTRDLTDEPNVETTSAVIAVWDNLLQNFVNSAKTRITELITKRTTESDCDVGDSDNASLQTSVNFAESDLLNRTEMSKTELLTESTMESNGGGDDTSLETFVNSAESELLNRNEMRENELLTESTIASNDDGGDRSNSSLQTYVNFAKSKLTDLLNKDEVQTTELTESTTESNCGGDLTNASLQTFVNSAKSNLTDLLCKGEARTTELLTESTMKSDCDVDHTSASLQTFVNSAKSNLTDVLNKDEVRTAELLTENITESNCGGDLTNASLQTFVKSAKSKLTNLLNRDEMRTELLTESNTECNDGGGGVMVTGICSLQTFLNSESELLDDRAETVLLIESTTEHNGGDSTNTSLQTFLNSSKSELTDLLEKDVTRTTELSSESITGNVGDSPNASLHISVNSAKSDLTDLLNKDKTRTTELSTESIAGSNDDGGSVIVTDICSLQTFVTSSESELNRSEMGKSELLIESIKDSNCGGDSTAASLQAFVKSANSKVTDLPNMDEMRTTELVSENTCPNQSKTAESNGDAGYSDNASLQTFLSSAKSKLTNLLNRNQNKCPQEKDNTSNVSAKYSQPALASNLPADSNELDCAHETEHVPKNNVSVNSTSNANDLTDELDIETTLAIIASEEVDEATSVAIATDESDIESTLAIIASEELNDETTSAAIATDEPDVEITSNIITIDEPDVIIETDEPDVVSVWDNLLQNFVDSAKAKMTKLLSKNTKKDVGGSVDASLQTFVSSAKSKITDLLSKNQNKHSESATEDSQGTSNQLSQENMDSVEFQSRNEDRQGTSKQLSQRDFDSHSVKEFRLKISGKLNSILEEPTFDSEDFYDHETVDDEISNIMELDQDYLMQRFLASAKIKLTELFSKTIPEGNNSNSFRSQEDLDSHSVQELQSRTEVSQEDIGYYVIEEVHSNEDSQDAPNQETLDTYIVEEFQDSQETSTRLPQKDFGSRLVKELKSRTEDSLETSNRISQAHLDSHSVEKLQSRTENNLETPNPLSSVEEFRSRIAGKLNSVLEEPSSDSKGSKSDQVTANVENSNIMELDQDYLVQRFLTSAKIKLTELFSKTAPEGKYSSSFLSQEDLDSHTVQEFQLRAEEASNQLIKEEFEPQFEEFQSRTEDSQEASYQLSKEEFKSQCHSMENSQETSNLLSQHDLDSHSVEFQDSQETSDQQSHEDLDLVEFESRTEDNLETSNQLSQEDLDSRLAKDQSTTETSLEPSYQQSHKDLDSSPVDEHHSSTEDSLETPIQTHSVKEFRSRITGKLNSILEEPSSDSKGSKSDKETEDDANSGIMETDQDTIDNSSQTLIKSSKSILRDLLSKSKEATSFQKVDSEEKQLVCPQCQKIFHIKSLLTFHIRMHNEGLHNQTRL